jgi:polysaccharide pyruvyl transferase WcaK-like protein
MSKIKGCDILVLNGEGSLHGYNSQLIKFFYYLSYAKSLKKKVCIINHSLQFDNPSAERYLRLLYRLSDLNFFREIISIENAGLKNCANSFIVPDAAFSNYYLDTDSVDFTTLMPTKYILASGSVILNSGNKGYFELLKKLEEYYQIPVVFIASCSADKKLESIIRVNYKWRYFDNNDLSVEQVQKLIKGAQFFYSGRFHLNILSAISSKIFIPFISNTIKMEGLLSLLSYPFKAIDFNNFEIDIVFCSIIELISRKQQIEWELGQRCKQLVEDLEFNYQRNMVI